MILEIAIGIVLAVIILALWPFWLILGIFLVALAIPVIIGFIVASFFGPKVGIAAGILVVIGFFGLFGD